jgi:phenylacetate-CoA ligase
MKLNSRFESWNKSRKLFRDMQHGNPIPLEEYQRMQLMRLQNMLKNAYENSDYYKTRFDQMGVKPENIQNLEDITRLPLLSKEELRANYPSGMLVKNVSSRNRTELTTTGHTGLPVRFYRDRRQLRSSASILVLGSRFLPRIVKAWTGLEAGSKLTVMFPEDDEYDISIIVKQVLRWPRLFSYFLQWIDTSVNPQQQLLALVEGRPDILISDPNTLCNMAMVARQKGLLLHKPKLLVITSEQMDEYSRQVITQSFCQNYIEHYGAEEVGTIGFSCLQHQGFHVLISSVVVEILQDGKPVPEGSVGDVVVTDLNNTLNPIIRYTGLKDAGVLSTTPCPCGSHLPLLRLTEARVRDSFILPDSTVVHPRAIVVALKHLPGLADYQVIQEKIDVVKVQLVAQKSNANPLGLEGKMRDTATSNLRDLLGDGVNVRVEIVNSIPVPSGQRAHPNVLSLVPKHP